MSAQRVYLEDVEWLLDTGCTWTHIAWRLHVTPSAIDRALRRAGRSDLIQRLHATEHHAA